MSWLSKTAACIYSSSAARRAFFSSIVPGTLFLQLDLATSEWSCAGAPMLPGAEAPLPAWALTPGELWACINAVASFKFQATPPSLSDLGSDRLGAHPAYVLWCSDGVLRVDASVLVLTAPKEPHPRVPATGTQICTPLAARFADCSLSNNEGIGCITLLGACART